MNKRKDIVPNNLKEYRMKVGLTQMQVANLLGFTTQERISHWEIGKNIPNIMNLFKLCAIYRVTPESLYPELMQDLEKKSSQRSSK